MDDFDFVPQFNMSTAAPKISEYDYPARRRRRTPPTIAERTVIEETLNKTKLAIFVIAALIIIGSMLTSVIFLDKQIVINDADIAKLTAQVSQQKAENVRLNAERGSIISADNIQKYAVTVLGMQQAERYQIHYFEDRDGDKVVVAGGKASSVDT